MKPLENIIRKGENIGNQNLLLFLWWHISATRYEIAVMIMLENYRDKTNFPGNSIEDSKTFHDKNIAIFLLSHFVLGSIPQVTLTISIIK